MNKVGFFGESFTPDKKLYIQYYDTLKKAVAKVCEGTAIEKYDTVFALISAKARARKNRFVWLWLKNDAKEKFQKIVFSLNYLHGNDEYVQKVLESNLYMLNNIIANDDLTSNVNALDSQLDFTIQVLTNYCDAVNARVGKNKDFDVIVSALEKPKDF